MSFNPFGNMYLPFSPETKAIETLIWSVIKSQDFKNEMSNYIRMEVEASKTKYTKENHVGTLSYSMLTRGSVDMQAKMAASGYDVYGKTLIPSNKPITNDNVYKNMKNKINYGRSSSKPHENRGQYSFAKGG